MSELKEQLNYIERITIENNKMLKGIIQWINSYSKHMSEDNIDDFGRNVLANLISNSFDGFNRKNIK
jgi:hypothetical protein